VINPGAALDAREIIGNTCTEAEIDCDIAS